VKNIFKILMREPVKYKKILAENKKNERKKAEEGLSGT